MRHMITKGMLQLIIIVLVTVGYYTLDEYSIVFRLDQYLWRRLLF